jgi:hypothetical protein
MSTDTSFCPGSPDECGRERAGVTRERARPASLQKRAPGQAWATVSAWTPRYLASCVGPSSAWPPNTPRAYMSGNHALVCRDAVASGRLRVLFGPSPAVRTPVHAVFPSRRYLAAKVRVFLDALAVLVEPMAPLDDRQFNPYLRGRSKRKKPLASSSAIVGASTPKYRVRNS